MQVGLDVWGIQVFVFEEEIEEIFEKYDLLRSGEPSNNA